MSFDSFDLGQDLSTVSQMDQSNSPNASFGIDASDPLFYVCWRRQSCRWCLEGDAACSWCAVTSTCVPNSAHLPILAPLGSSQICPLGSKERWELRALPFGCNVSTITFLTAVGSVLSTLAAIALGMLVGEVEGEGLGIGYGKGKGERRL
ncbi:hypothetical protein P170DRAFT_480723 [Aspergillus steynii IBT 23096]|uniref:PSI domain-containing protein n=1 Tax=Aspergillus steynii IBT 23096 TaxID=1392250 RepID=A0A2I2FT22_9EURO|nr:uncharacterized protein P170DRAFT_480723 [Aspergillus steynii IBT 23096]PLB43764.1 hypothetical protein P170DRAFT_480723 [Aspergillus steynii IBT 23096]